MIKGCKTLKAHNSWTAADTLVKLYIFARLSEIFHLSPWSSLYRQPLQSSAIIAQGPKTI